MSKFDDFLSEPNQFSDGTWVAHGESTMKDFYEFVVQEGDLDEDVTLEKFTESVKEDWVHFHIRGDDYEFEGRPAWWLGCKGMKGSKRVLTF